MDSSTAQDYLRQAGLDGWLVYEHRQMNPVFTDLVGDVGHLTRPCFLWIPVDGPQHILAHAVEVARFSSLADTHVYSNRVEYRQGLDQLLKGSKRIAMEYSPYAELPLTSRVDGGTLDLVRSFGVDIVSSADLVTYVTARWDAAGVTLALTSRAPAEASTASCPGWSKCLLRAGPSSGCGGRKALLL